MDEDVRRAMKQYRGWVVVDVELTPAADGQHILRIQSPTERMRRSSRPTS